MKYMYEAIIEPSGKWLEAASPTSASLRRRGHAGRSLHGARPLGELHRNVAQEGGTLPAPTFGNDAARAATAWASWWSGTKTRRMTRP
jgi:hypothetical protein